LVADQVSIKPNILKNLFMKIIKLISYAVITFVALYFFSCTKDNNTQSNVPPPGTGNGSVAGVITDLNNTPVSNATVVGGTATTVTDANGKFTLTKVQFTADTVLVNVTKGGFFQGSKSFVSNTNTVNNAKIQLIPKPSSSTITASSGGNVTIPGGGSVNFGGGFVNASNGNTYTGNVSVSTFYLNPTDQNFSASVPGYLKGVSSTNQQGVLQSFGVVAVELNDASGNKLQLAQGKTATITLSIPAALLGNAPVSVPLWYFDDVKGWWKEEGTATKQGNNYVGVVKHFSFWNAGDISGAVNLTASFTDSISGTAFANKLVTITRFDSTSTNGHTDNTGTVSGLVPVNEVLIMKVFGDCGAIVYSKNIGPFSKDTALDNIKIFNSCNQTSLDTTQYIHLTLNGNNYSWQATDSISGITRPDTLAGSWQSYIQAWKHFVQGNNYNGLSFSFNSNSVSPGTYNCISFNAYINQTNYGNHGSPAIIISQFDGVGGYIIGTSSGQVILAGSVTTMPFSMNFKVKRN